MHSWHGEGKMYSAVLYYNSGFCNFLTNQRVTVSLQFRRQKFTQEGEGVKLKSEEHIAVEG
jgi:hypothetical protein